MSPTPTVHSVLLSLACAFVPSLARAEAGVPPPPPTIVPTPSPPDAAELGAPRLRIASDFPVTLHEVAPFSGDQILCQAPCERVVDGRAGQPFYFGGDEIPASRPFTLAEKSGDVVADVHAGSAAVLATGRALMAPAIFHLIAGAVIAPFLAFPHDPSTALDLQYAAGATLSVGGALLISSIVMLAEGRTSFRFIRRGDDGGAR